MKSNRTTTNNKIVKNTDENPKINVAQWIKKFNFDKVNIEAVYNLFQMVSKYNDKADILDMQKNKEKLCKVLREACLTNLRNRENNEVIAFGQYSSGWTSSQGLILAQLSKNKKKKDDDISLGLLELLQYQEKSLEPSLVQSLNDFNNSRNPLLFQALADNIDILLENSIIATYPKVLLKGLSEYDVPRFLSVIQMLKHMPIDIKSKDDFTRFINGLANQSSFSICFTTLIMKTYSDLLWNKDKVKMIAEMIDDVLLDKHVSESYFFAFIDCLFEQLSDKYLIELLSYLNKYEINILDLFPESNDKMLKLCLSWNDEGNQERFKIIANILSEKLMHKIQNKFSDRSNNNQKSRVIDDKIDDQIEALKLKLQRLELKKLEQERHSKNQNEGETNSVSIMQNQPKENTVSVVNTMPGQVDLSIVSSEQIGNQIDIDIVSLINDFCDVFCDNNGFKILVTLLCLARLRTDDTEKVFRNIAHLFTELNLKQIEGESIKAIFCSLENLSFSSYCINVIIENTKKIEDKLKNNIKHYKREDLVSVLCSIEREKPILFKKQNYSMSSLISDFLCGITDEMEFSNDCLKEIIEQFGLLEKQNKNTDEGESDVILKNKVSFILDYINKLNKELAKHYDSCHLKFSKSIEKLQEYSTSQLHAEYFKCILASWGERQDYYFHEMDILHLIKLISTHDSHLMTNEIIDRELNIIKYSDYPITPFHCISLLAEIIKYSHNYSESHFLTAIENYFSEKKTAEEIIQPMIDNEKIQEMAKEEIKNLIMPNQTEEEIGEKIILRMTKYIKQAIEQGHIALKKNELNDLIYDLKNRRVTQFNVYETHKPCKNDDYIIFETNAVGKEDSTDQKNNVNEDKDEDEESDQFLSADTSTNEDENEDEDEDEDEDEEDNRFVLNKI